MINTSLGKKLRGIILPLTRLGEPFSGSKVIRLSQARRTFLHLRTRPPCPPAVLLAQLILEAILQFRADFGNFHARADQELAAEQIMRPVLVREFSDHAAILAVLIPAETSVRDGLRADVLEAAKNGVLLGNLEGFAQDLDFDEAFVGAKNLSAACRGS